MEVALYARVSTPNQQQEGTITSQVQSLHLYIRQQGWSLLPTHEYIDEGISGARLDRPALDRLRDCAQRGLILIQASFAARCSAAVGWLYLNFTPTRRPG